MSDSLQKSLDNLKALDAQTQEDLNPNYIKSITMDELLDKVYEIEPSVIENILTVGLYVIAGMPKVGKSFLVAQMAYHVSMGIPLWGYKVTRGDVLYLALEDRYSRLQQRLYTMFGDNTSANLHLAVKSGTLEGSLENQLQNFIYSHPDTKLIIIDTLKKINDTGNESCSYAKDYDVIDRLKAIADRNKICILVVHHTRKEKAEDIFQMISGTNGLYGAADGALIFHKEKRIDREAYLNLSGRDYPDQTLTLSRNPETLQWDFVTAETDIGKEKPEPLLIKIADIITENNPVWEGSPTELAELLNTELKPNSLIKKLNVCASRLHSDYGIIYETKRIHDGRRIKLVLEKRDDCVGSDG